MNNKKKPPLKSNIERRASFVEYRNEGEEGIVEGYAAVFGKEADLGPFTEVIERGAFKNAIATSDIRALFNHDANIVLARKRPDSDSRDSTLQVWEDEIGLKYRFTLPETQKELREAFKRGDVDQSSFAFTVTDSGVEWRSDQGKDIRIIKEGGISSIFDVSPVTYPAYEDTSVALRSLEDLKESKEQREEKTETQEPNQSWKLKHKLRLTELTLIEAEGL